jgi:hypothetical protein
VGLLPPAESTPKGWFLKIQMMKGLHVMSRRVLQVTDQSCVGGVLSNRKALGPWSVLQGHNLKFKFH